jgi:hypothetical protein
VACCTPAVCYLYTHSLYRLYPLHVAVCYLCAAGTLLSSVELLLCAAGTMLSKCARCCLRYRYPVEQCRGKADKYTAYEQAKQQHKQQQDQQQLAGRAVAEEGTTAGRASI